MFLEKFDRVLLNPSFQLFLAVFGLLAAATNTYLDMQISDWGRTELRISEPVVLDGFKPFVRQLVVMDVMASYE